MRIDGYNSLNHNYYGCYFANCVVGVSCDTGGQCQFNACKFHNSSNYDVRIKGNTVMLKGCHSTSQNFANAQAVIRSCTHEHASEGYFYESWPGSSGIGVDTNTAVFKGNHSTNGKLGATGYSTSFQFTLLGNTFDNPDYLEVVGSTSVWEDGDFV